VLGQEREGAGAQVAAQGPADVAANELSLVYEARGMSKDDAAEHAREVLATHRLDADDPSAAGVDENEAIGSPWNAAISSFLFFASGALIPVLPYLFGAHHLEAIVIASAAVGLALLGTGAIVGILSGASPWKRALRQLLIGFGAAAVTYVLGLLFGASGI
jgi:VIT1/CCC1 family predicted Fe2+/Mn2+ transporter